MTFSGNKRAYIRFILTLLAFTVAIPWFTRIDSYAAPLVPDTIRVALFLNLPAKSFTSITPAATLQSAAGVAVSWRDPQFTVPIGAFEPGRPVRFAMDGYRAMVFETEDWNAATAVLKKLQASSQAAAVTRLAKSGKTVYQVTEGAYATAALANAALTKYAPSAAAAGRASLSAPKVLGPWAVESGPYAGMAEASAAAEQIGTAGLDAFAAVKVAGGAITYVVRVGQAADAAGAAPLTAAAAAAGGLNVRVPAAGEPYALIRQDMTAAADPDNPALLYAIPANAGVVLRAEPDGDGTMQLTERSKRVYRGAMEMSVFANALAVVNEVNFEQYLYSVVGSEVGSTWPPEAQKAQAVAARSYALAAGMSFQIANVVDTTLSQVYSGTGSENANAIAGVNATAGEVLVQNGKVVSAVFSSNAGGMTADSLTEGWGNDAPYLAGGVLSPDDGPQSGKLDWYDVALPSGQRGYVRSDLLQDAGKNSAGVSLLSVIADGTVMRARPLVETSVNPVARLSAGSTVVMLGKVPEYTVYSWVEAPLAPDAVLASLNKFFKLTGPIQTFEVSGRGPSGRVTLVKVNGSPLTLKTPTSWGSAAGGLKSSMFSVEETARMTIAGTAGETRELPRQAGEVRIVGADGAVRTAGDGNVFVMDAAGNARLVTPKPAFIISGKGFGHGLGMSQYGAKKLAEQGNDYQYILQYYYKNVTIQKDAAG